MYILIFHKSSILCTKLVILNDHQDLFVFDYNQEELTAGLSV